VFALTSLSARGEGRVLWKVYVYTFIVHLTKDQSNRAWDWIPTRSNEKKRKRKKKRREKEITEQEEGIAAWRDFHSMALRHSWSFNLFSSQSTFVRVKNGKGKKRKKKERERETWYEKTGELQLFAVPLPTFGGVWAEMRHNRFPKCHENDLCGVSGSIQTSS